MFTSRKCWILPVILSCVIFICLPAHADNPAAADTQPTRIELPEQNISFDVPPANWYREAVKKRVTDACLEFHRSDPAMVCSIIAEVPSPDPDGKTDRMVQVLLNRLSGNSTDFELVEKAHQVIDGVRGTRVCVRITQGDESRVIFHWVCACPHGFYQIVVSGSPDDETRVREQALAMFDRFHFKDPTITNSPAVVPPYHSLRYGYTVDMSQAGWLPTATAVREATFPSADFAAVRNLYTPLMIIPISELGQKLECDALARALLQRMAFSFSDVTEIRPYSQGTATGMSFSFARDIKQMHFVYRARVLMANGFGYLVVAWTSKAEQVPDLTSALDAFTADKTAGQFDQSAMSARERSLHTYVFNDMGNFASSQQRFRNATQMHLCALQLKTDPVLVENVVCDYVSGQQSSEALALVRKYNDQLSKRQSLLARAAMLEASFGDHNTAINLYGQLFQNTRYEELAALHRYIDLLIKANRISEALAAVRQYRTHADCTDLAVLESGLDLKANDVDGAIAILLDRKAFDHYNINLNYALGDAYLTGKRYSRAAECDQEMIDQGSKSPWVYEQLGVAQVGMKSYRQAKASFELAAAQAPDSQQIQSWLRNVSRMLGEGDNSGIKTEIAAVPIPSSLQTLPAADANFGTDANAIYLSSINAISFEKGKEQKSTRYCTIKVLNSAGVDEYNAFHFAFDPDAEQIYVNKLEVKDADGKVSATGSVSDCYALDSPREQSATYARTLNIPVPGLKPGSTIELVLTRKERDQAQQFHYSQNMLSFYKPCMVSTLYLKGDLSSVKAITSGNLKQETIDGGWCWTAKNPPRFSDETMVADFETFLPVVTLVDASASWERMASEYLGTIRDMITPDPDSAAMAVALTQGKTSDSDRLAALLKYVQGDFTYQAIEFGRRARIPNKAGQIIHNHYGDCKDHALLLHQLLNASGIPAHLVLVRSNGPLATEAPSMDQFDHMIVCVPGKNASDADRYFDCTDKDTNLPIGIPYGLAGKHVLVLDPDHPRLEMIPDYAADSSAILITRDVSLVPSGDLSVHDVITCKGYYGSSMRGSFQRMDPKDRKPQMHDVLAGRGRVDLTLQSASFENLDHVESPFVMDVHYALPHRFSSDGDGLIGSLPALFEHEMMIPGHVDPRQTPFAIRYPVEYVTKTTLSPPTGYGLKQPLASYNFNSSFETDSVSIKNNNDGTIQETFVGRANTGQYPPQAYAAYERSRQDLLANIERNIVLVKK